ncbi:hypothetical protein T4A_5288 [Trichinella pseudospiralis]|nr:hypothetical protein T4A_5288 [Trichinella pseudospiralis]
MPVGVCTLQARTHRRGTVSTEACRRRTAGFLYKSGRNVDMSRGVPFAVHSAHWRRRSLAQALSTRGAKWRTYHGCLRIAFASNESPLQATPASWANAYSDSIIRLIR